MRRLSAASWDLLLTEASSEESGSGSGSGSDSDEDGDVKMDTEEDGKPSDPDDLSAYNLDNYDEETSRGTGQSAKLRSRAFGLS